MQLAVFSLQLSVMMRGGVELSRALESLSLSAPDTEGQELARRLHTRLLQGNYLSRALAEYPSVFSPFYVGMVEVGERTGGLVVVLDRLAQWLRRDGELLQRLRAALVYPLSVAGFSLAMLVTVFATILPGLVQMIAEMEGQLPWYSRLLVLLVSGLQQPWMWLVAGLGLAAAGLLMRQVSREQWFELGVSLPLVGNLLIYSSLARFSVAAALMLEVGVDLLRALRLAAQASGSPLLVREMPHVVEGIRDGESVATMFRHLSHCPRVFWQMIEVAEESARMSSAFTFLARHLEAEVGYRIEAVMALMEPLLISLLAGLVGFTVVALMVPLYGTLANFG